MEFSDITHRLNAVLHFQPEDCHVLSAYTSDLLSDVMAHAAADSMLITIQAHKNTVAVCALLGIKAVLFCNGRVPDQETVEAARKESIALATSDEDQFTCSWKIHQALSVE